MLYNNVFCMTFDCFVFMYISSSLVLSVRSDVLLLAFLVSSISVFGGLCFVTVSARRRAA